MGLFKEAADKIKQLLHLKKDIEHYADCLIRNENGDILLMRRSYQDDFEPGKWCLPGGKIESGEVPEYAAARELFEETGLQTELEFIQAVERKDSVTCYFQGHILTSEYFPILDNDEHYAIEWVPINRLAQYDLLLDLKDILMNKIKLPIYSTKLMKLEIQDVNDLFKRIEYVEKSFDADEMSTEDYFICKAIINTHLQQVIKVGIEKGMVDELVKARKKATLGEIRNFGGRDYIMTTSGWKYYGKGTGKAAKTHKKETHSISDGGVSKKQITYEDLNVRSAVPVGGSGGAMLVTATNGKKFIIKEEGGDPSHTKKNTADQLKSEALTDSLYRILGINASKSTILNRPDGKIVKVSKFLENSKTLGAVYDDYEKGSPSRNQIEESIKKGFLADCLLMNWDVVGANMDNMVVVDNLTTGKTEVHRIDNGGALMYRAKMGKKGSESLTADIKELSTFLSDKNPSAKKVFDGISHDELVEQARNIVNNKEDFLEAIKSSNLEDAAVLVDVMEKRINWIDSMYLKEKEAEKPTVNVTDEYEKRLMSSDFHGNAGIKEAIIKHIREVEERNEERMKVYAKEKGISLEEYKERCQKHIESLMTNAELFRATDSNILDYVFPEDGRFKSQFETDTSHGSLSPVSRANVENVFFGFGGVDVNRTQRPIYGYTSDNKNGIQNYKGTHPPSNGASGYGGVTVRMKDEVKKRATFMFGDSLGASYYQACTPVSHPHFTSFNFGGGDPLDKYTSLSKLESISYVEVQYHGQLTSKDIESIHISPYTGVSSDSEHPTERSWERVNSILEKCQQYNKKAVIYGKS